MKEEGSVDLKLAIAVSNGCIVADRRQATVAMWWPYTGIGLASQARRGRRWTRCAVT
jgi:hypothetical protein